MFIERSKLCTIADQISLWLSDDGFECIDLDWEASSRTLRVYVDHANGVGFEQCGMVSTKLVQIAELDELIPCEFNLEISSPGIERPLRTRSHFEQAKAANASIDVKLSEKVNNRKKGVGTIEGLDGDLITMKTAEGVWTFPLDMIQKAFQLADWEKVSQNAKETS